MRSARKSQRLVAEFVRSLHDDGENDDETSADNNGPSPGHSESGIWHL